MFAYSKDEHVKLTQELLEEAKETELLNLQSLEKYQQLELEKKTRSVKKTVIGPLIRYLSTVMPLIEDVSAEMERIDVEEDEVLSLSLSLSSICYRKH